MIHPNDVERWRAKLDQIEAAAARDDEVQETWRQLDALRASRNAEARELVDALVDSRDFGAFRTGADAWSRRPGPYNAFSGFGQMWLNQVANNLPDDPAVVDVLVRALRTPSSAEEAQARFEEVEVVTRDLAGKGQPAVGRIPYVLSVFWATDSADPDWPILWKSAPDRMHDLGWVSSWSNVDRYAAYLDAARTFYPDDAHRVERLMWFLTERERFVGVNPALGEACVEASALMATFTPGAGYSDEADAARAASLAAQLKGELQLASAGLLDDIRRVTGLELEKSQLQARISFDKDAAYRADTYAAWALPGGMSSPGLRLWATRSGLAMGAYGGWGGDGTKAELERVARVFQDELPDGYTFFGVRPHLTGDRLVPSPGYTGGEVFAGRWWTWDELPTGLELKSQMLTHAERLAPLVRAASAVPDEGRTEDVPAGGIPSAELRHALARFKAERPYPNDKDEWHEEQRVIFAQMLSAENLSIFDLELFRLLINGKRYGNPGPQAMLNTSLGAMDSVQLDAFASRLREILWGDGEVENRLDRALDWDDLGTSGLAESVLLKMLAITDSRRFLPTFPLSGKMGKIAMLRRLRLEEPAGDLSRGHQQVVANDTLRRVLEPLLPGDPWGQAQFAYWLLDHDGTDKPDDEDRLVTTAEDLLVPEPFLRELNDLLQEKGQIIFYGPPGTGKTYLADRFAAALQPDPERRMLVQFHPSTSYEDFFEGYRPRTDERGQMSYELRPGPLAMMAEKAEGAPGIPHFLIIDEINRANLPRVFGELLFLLEYRNKAVRTAYRPDEPFELPKNLFFIGTMNTADRSIAMLDAALRRRFHFIPFLPNRPPLDDVLSKWLTRHGEPSWVAGLVEKVNEQLRVLLKGEHLQIGPSHFMVAGAGVDNPEVLTDARLKRIWDYNIRPFIEDQLYGKPVQLETFTWANVVKAYGPGTQAAEQAEQTASGDALDEVSGG